MTRRISHYRILREIGAGSAAVVYLAEDEQTGRKVALKLLHQQLTTNESHVRRFHQEAEWVALVNHPNIVALYEVGEDRGQHYMAVEYVEGRNLRELFPPELPVDQALSIAHGILCALSAAHEAWIVHRDVKPENVIVRPDGTVKVFDFGLAKLTQPRSGKKPITNPGMVVGTLQYLAPEQILGEGVDPRTDLFGVGVVLYEMLQGEPPFTGPTNRDLLRAILRKQPAPLVTPNGPLPDGIQQFIRRALEKDIDSRYQSADEMLSDLDSIRSGSAGP